MLNTITIAPEALANATPGGQKGEVFNMRFIEPGLVRYEGAGQKMDVLVQKPALDSMVQSFLGCPVFNELHRDVSTKDFSRGKADGVISRVWFSPDDGWFWCDAVIWDEETRANIRERGYSLSCAYNVLKWSETAGRHNNVPFDDEVLAGQYTHLAIVPNPRYEGARILLNAKESLMKLMFWKKDNGELKNSAEMEASKVTIVLENGKEYTVEQAVQAAEEQEAAASALANSKLADDQTVEVNGRKWTGLELKNAVAAKLKNEEEKEKDKDHDDKKHDEKPVENCVKCNEKKNADDKAEKEKADKEAEEKKNSDDKAAAEKKEADEKAEKDKKENALKADEAEKKAAKDRFQELENARNKAQQKIVPSFTSQDDRLKLGKERYGKLPA